MRVWIFLVFVLAIGLALFAIQNSSSPPVTIRFLMWSVETSVVLTILGSMALGVLLTLLLWVPRTLRGSFQKRKAPEKEQDR